MPEVSRKKQAYDLYLKGIDYYIKNKFGEAINIFRSALKLDDNKKFQKAIDRTIKKQEVLKGAEEIKPKQKKKVEIKQPGKLAAVV